MEKLSVATELLDRALQMFYEGDAYFAALHLAGAAEEILGVYVKNKGGCSAYENFHSDILTWLKEWGVSGAEVRKNVSNEINYAKNRTKHMNQQDDESILFDPKAEAYELIDRAVSNYYFLMGHYPIKQTKLIQRFNDELIDNLKN